MSWRTAAILWAALCVAIATARMLQDPVTGTASWDAARASGFAAYLLAWASVVAGIMMHMRFRVPGMTPARLLEVHRILSTLVISFLAAHVLAILVDPHISFSIVDGFVPFTSEWRPFQVGLGTLAQWLFVIVLASTALAARMPYSTWRMLHFLSFPAYVLMLLHGVMSGSDSGQFAAIMVYAMTAAAVAFLAVFRVAGRDWDKDQPRLTPLASTSSAPANAEATWRSLQRRLFEETQDK